MLQHGKLRALDEQITRNARSCHKGMKVLNTYCPFMHALLSNVAVACRKGLPGYYPEYSQNFG